MNARKPDPRASRYRTLSEALPPRPTALVWLPEVQPDPHGDSLFSRDGAGLPQDAAKNAKYWAIGSPNIQLADLFAGQDHGGTKSAWER